MGWKFTLGPRASKQLSKLAKPTQQMILDYLTVRVLACDDPRDLGKALCGNMRGIWRYRVDKYRILCRIEDHALIILVLEVGKRDSVYD